MTENSFTITTATSKSLLRFFLWVFVLSFPFFLIGALTSFQLLPALPISSLGVLCPVTAAAILAYRENKSRGVRDLFERAFDFKRIKVKIWYVPLILIMPGVMILSYVVQRLMGVPVPAPQFSLAAILALLVSFFIGALCEELGWSGYATDPLQKRFGALGGALVLGVVWAVWHYIPLLEIQRSWTFILWWSLGTVASRVIIVWLYNNTGRSVFVAALYHTMVNLTWQLFPINGSYYDPHVTGTITAIVAVVVVIVWGPRTLTRYHTATMKRQA